MLMRFSNGSSTPMTMRLQQLTEALDIAEFAENTTDRGSDLTGNLTG
jgi:hypothetical protein